MKRFSLRTWAIAAWMLVAIAVAVAVTSRGKPGKLYPTFVDAGSHFAAAEPLYGPVPEGQDQYRYSPLVAASFAPWSGLPTSVGSVLWRWLQALAFLVALRWWAKTALPKVAWPVLALIALPFVAGNIFNAQLNPLVAAMMLVGAAAFSRGQYSLAALAIAGATGFKMYPLALGLLLLVIQPRMFGPRLLFALVAVGALPFLLQDRQYVAEQFVAWADRVGGDDRSGQELHRGYFDAQKLLRHWGVETSLLTYRGLEVAAGALAAMFVASTRRLGWRPQERIDLAAGLGFIWCTLFGPATESATYMLLAPSIASAVVSARGWQRWFVAPIVACFLSMVIAPWFPRPISDPIRALLPQAHGAVLLLGYVCLRRWMGSPRAKRRYGVSSKSIGPAMGFDFFLRGRSGGSMTKRP